MLFGVKANVGSNPTVTANEKAPASLTNKGKQGLLFCLEKTSGNAAVTNFPRRSVFNHAGATRGLRTTRIRAAGSPR